MNTDGFITWFSDHWPELR